MSLPFYLKGWLPAFFCFKGTEMDAVWDLVVGWLDLALFFLDGGGCRSGAQIWESEVTVVVVGRELRFGSRRCWGAAPMGDCRRLHPVLWDGCLLRLLFKPAGDGISPAQDGACCLRRWWPATRTTSVGGSRRIQGLRCNFTFS